jgi:selenide, water dikinase
MGGRPISSLTILAFPANGDPNTLEQILRGGLSKMAEANCTVVGGHSIRDDELKFGYAVTGTIHPDKVWKNVGAEAGDALILTKALGTGVISTAIKQQKASPAWLAAATISMTTLNRDAADALHAFEAAHPHAIHAVTDVTGFGLLGHAREMAIGSGVAFELDHTKIAYLDGAIDAARAGFFSAGMKNNREFVEGCAEFAPAVPDEFRALVVDPQTSGGLLVAIDHAHAAEAVTTLKRHNTDARIIGSVKPKTAHLLYVV